MNTYTLQRKMFNTVKGANPKTLKVGIAGGVLLGSLTAPAGALANQTAGSDAVTKTDCGNGLDTIANLAGRAIGVIITLALIAVVVFYVVAGFMWMAAGGNQGKVQKAQMIIKNATIGAVIVLCAYLIRKVLFALVKGGGGGDVSATTGAVTCSAELGSGT